ncbi:MAG: AI-2E family transporter [Lachnospirales bacterium]
MYKFFKNNYNLKRSLYTLGVIIIAILFYRITENLHVNNAFSTVINVLSPFIIGVVIAYILNCITNFIERKVLVKFKVFKSNSIKIQKRKRKLSIFISLLCLMGIIVGIFAYIIPEMISSIENLIQFIMKMDYTTVHTSVNKFLLKNNIHISPEIVVRYIHSFIEFFEDLANSLEYIPNMVTSLVEYSINVASSFINVILGLMISIYILNDKEQVVALGKKIIKALFSDAICQRLTLYVKELNHAFNEFFFSKLVDSFIIGLLYYIIALIFSFPYPSLCALIIGITNMIPYFGPFIGAVPVIALTLLVKPLTAIGVAIAIVVLQQFDGIILGPKILGESINLNPVGVIFAITIGGAIAGPLGMFFGVPVFSVIYRFAMIAVENLYQKKHQSTEREDIKNE